MISPGSGNTYIRYDGEQRRFKGKLKKIYDQLHEGKLGSILLTMRSFSCFTFATRQAMDHIEYWCDRFTSEKGYKPLQLRVLCPLEKTIALKGRFDTGCSKPISQWGLFDPRATDYSHIAVGRHRRTYGVWPGCALPVVLAHNTPKQLDLPILGSRELQFLRPLPRISRHREF